MNNYQEMKAKHKKEVNAFPMFFAFNNRQFEEGMKKLGLEPSETNKIYKLGSTGGYYRKSDSTILKEMLDRQEAEMKEAMKDADFVYNMFYYELGNYEYNYTCSVTDTLDALGLTYEEIENNKLLLEALQKACKAQLDIIE
jgi:hypothetical protein